LLKSKWVRVTNFQNWRNYRARSATAVTKGPVWWLFDSVSRPAYKLLLEELGDNGEVTGWECGLRRWEGSW